MAPWLVGKGALVLPRVGASRILGGRLRDPAFSGGLRAVLLGQPPLVTCREQALVRRRRFADAPLNRSMSTLSKASEQQFEKGLIRSET